MTHHQQSPLLAAAVAYATRGWAVYPVAWPVWDPRAGRWVCACRAGVACPRPAKHPLTARGVHGASSDPAQVHAWWARWPAANVGLATGRAFDVLDIDQAADLTKVRWVLAGMRPGPVVRTGSGWHVYVQPTGRGCQPPRDLPGVDWRGRGGGVLAPPSRHASGQLYRWVSGRGPDRPMPAVPGRLRARLHPEVPARGLGVRVPGDAHAYARAALASGLERLARAPVGARNRTLNREAFQLFQLAGAGLVAPDVVEAAFREAAQARGLPAREVARTLQSARRAGLARPRDPERGRSDRAAPHRGGPGREVD